MTTAPTPAATARDALLARINEAGHCRWCYVVTPADLDNLITLAAPEAPGRVSALETTPGDFAKALHDAHRMLGYWPDPNVIDGRWEMWGVVLHSLLAAAEASGRVAGGEPCSNCGRHLDEHGGYGDPDYPAWRRECPTPAPTPSDPGDCDDHHISDMLGYCPKCGKDHPDSAPAPTPSEPVARVDRWGEDGPCGFVHPGGTPCLIERYKHPNVVAIGHRWIVQHGSERVR